ncbi:MAG: DsbC family protein [Gammaproteobacteria bacterium]|nr:MAG: DsbC family protein [Gammaproteobacteria bacterium]RLA20737.1 MAG: DsbC family protein [Gammaproteobacteria bacterium]
MKKSIGFLGVMGLMVASLSAAVASDGVKEALAKSLPGVEVDSIKSTPVPGLYQIAFGPRVMYVSEDGRYMLQGSMVDLATRENLTDPAQAKAMLSAVEKVGEDDMIIYKPKNKKHTMTVFTDIDCGYCRKLHNQMDAYLEEGFEVRYLFFPRSGLNTNSYDKAVSVWCADDRNDALTKAKNNQHVESKTCNNPVKEHFELGMAMGVRGTPAILTDTGKLLPGYISPREIGQYFTED